MFTLAHELAHIWLGKSAAFDLRLMRPSEDTVETFCNKTAAEFLVPQHLLQKKWEQINLIEENCAKNMKKPTSIYQEML